MARKKQRTIMVSVNTALWIRKILLAKKLMSGYNRRVNVRSMITRGSKKCRKETPMSAVNIKKKRIMYLQFLYANVFLCTRILEIIESLTSITVPRGQIKPQKNRPKIKLTNTMIRAKRALVMIVRKAILVMSRTRGSRRKKIFTSFVGEFSLVCRKNQIKSPRKKICRIQRIIRWIFFFLPVTVKLVRQYQTSISLIVILPISISPRPSSDAATIYLTLLPVNDLLYHWVMPTV